MVTPSSSLAPIVVVVDRGASDASVRFGAAEALRTGRPLELVHVAPPGDGWLEMIGQDALRMASTVADAEIVGRVDVHCSLVRGNVVAELVRVAANAALVVAEQLPAGNHRRPWTSTAAALAEVIDVPIAVVPTGWIERRRGVVTVGVDPTAADETALFAAMTLARLRRAALRVVAAGPCSRTDVEERLDSLGGDACDVSIELGTGPATAALAEASVSSDIVVIGRHRPLRSTDSRFGTVGRELLDQLACPVLLTRPGHPHTTPGSAGHTPTEEHHMYARAGDRIVIRSAHLGGPVRDGEIIEVEHEDGRPPYHVRWSDTGRESLFFPGPDAQIDNAGPSYQAEYDVPAQTG